MSDSEHRSETWLFYRLSRRLFWEEKWKCSAKIRQINEESTLMVKTISHQPDTFPMHPTKYTRKKYYQNNQQIEIYKIQMISTLFRYKWQTKPFDASIKYRKAKEFDTKPASKSKSSMKTDLTLTISGQQTSENSLPPHRQMRRNDALWLLQRQER